MSEVHNEVHNDEAGDRKDRTDESGKGAVKTAKAFDAPAAARAPESREQRWVKYGANVLLSVVLVLGVSGIVLWGADKYHKRGDLTSSGSNSLKPQTINIIKDLTAPVKLVSLYPKLKAEDAGKQQDFSAPVANVLDEYRRNGKNIDVEIIDPVSQPEKLDAWIGEITRKYGGNVKAYKDLLDNFPKTVDRIKTLASQEVAKMKEMVAGLNIKSQAEAEKLGETLDIIQGAYATVAAFPQLLGDINEGIKEALSPENKFPDYKGQVGNVTSDQLGLGGFSRNCTAVRKRLEKLRDNPANPQPVRDYAKDAVPRFEQMQKLADDDLAKAKALGELKLDEIRRKLIPQNEGETTPQAIAVMGEKDVKLIEFRDVWKSGESTGMTSLGNGAPKLRFAGEQRITTAMLSLTQPTRPKVAFVRDGGPPLADSAQGGPFGDIADRLKAYNFDVIEKDLSGQSAQQAMQQRRPPPQEASDEDLRTAIWVAVSSPQSQMTPFGPMPGGASKVLGEKLAAHLNQGGSALALFDGRPARESEESIVFQVGDDLAVALRDWGVERMQGYREGPGGVEAPVPLMAIHESLADRSAPADDFIEQARREPPIFVLNEYGEHEITNTLQSLDSAMLFIQPIRFLDKPPAGTTVTRLLPLPKEPPTWGETDVSSLLQGKKPTLDTGKKSGDVPGPLFAGAAIEKKDKGRLAVIGCANFASSSMLRIRDEKIARATGAKVEVSRFPGNGELFTNTLFWLARQEKMIALSPSAMDTARIQPVSAGMLAFWRWGVLLLGLPALALFAGVMVWLKRRD